ncbi:DNA repair protein RecN [bacterium]|nr:DNA repair protein RecN [bacterium]
MLIALRISNYALIDALDLEWPEGFIALSGETGAGKSILLGALSLALGERADPAVLRTPDLKCVVEAEFDLQGRFQDFFEAQELDYADPALFRREIAPNGRSRSFVNDVPVRLETLKALSALLVDIHSQNDQMAVLEPEFQLEALDAVGATAEWLDAYRLRLADYRKAIKQWGELEDQIAAVRDLDYWNHQLDEFAQLKMDAEQFAALEQEFELLSHSEQIGQSLSEALRLLSQSEWAVRDGLIRSAGALRSSLGYDPSLGALMDRLESIRIELDDVVLDLEKRAEVNEPDPARLEQLKNRIDAGRNLMHKHRLDSFEALVQFALEVQERIERAHGLETERAALKEAMEAYRGELEHIGLELRTRRIHAIPQLTADLQAVLDQLDLSQARFHIELHPLNEPGAMGWDRPEILFSANPGQTPVPLKKAASGGEISRVMLAFKSVLGRYRDLPVLIFDEIDTGVSGRTAAQMAAVLHSMGASGSQIVAITHLPQIAGAADAHFKVEKRIEQGQTHTHIRRLNPEERRDELARMLSGSELTEAARTQAEILLNRKG